MKNYSLSNALVSLMAGVMMCNFPSVVKVLFESINEEAIHSQSRNVNDLSNAYTTLSDVLINSTLFNSIFYFAGIILIMRAIYKFKEFADGDEFIIEKTNNSNEVIKENKDVEIKDEDIKKEFFNELLSNFKPEPEQTYSFNLDFEDKDLNNKINKIGHSIYNIENNKENKNLNIEDKTYIINIKDKYIKDIHSSYIEVPKLSREKLYNNTSMKDLTLEQLELILVKLNIIEKSLMENKITNANIMKRFLNSKI